MGHGPLESPRGADYPLASKRMKEMENKSIDRSRDLELDFILRYINSKLETLAY